LHLSRNTKPLTPTLSQGERELACSVAQAITLILALMPPEVGPPEEGPPEVSSAEVSFAKVGSAEGGVGRSMTPDTPLPR